MFILITSSPRIVDPDDMIPRFADTVKRIFRVLRILLLTIRNLRIIFRYEEVKPLYKNLKKFRESLPMTQKEFAASLGIGLTTYNGYETGARDPKSDFWIAVAKKYKVTIDYLMGFSDDPHKTYTIETGPANQSVDEARERVIAQLCQMSPEDFQLVDAFVKWMQATRRGE